MKRLLTSLVLMSVASMTWADWMIEYDFQDGLPAGLYQATNRDLSTDFADVQDGMLRVVHGDLLEETSNLYMMLPLSTDLRAASEGIPGPVTLYFEMMVPDVGGSVGIVDVAFGLSNIDPDTVADVRYDSFSPMMRIDSGDQNFEYRDGGNGYVEVTQLEAGVKYSVWVEVDYSLNFAVFYIQGGVYTTVTEVGLGAFRKDPGEGETVDYFAALLSRGNSVDGPKGVDHMFFDNLAIDVTGKNLTNPTGNWKVQYDFEDGLPAEVYQATNRDLSTDFADVQDGMLRVVHGDLLEETSNLYVMLPFEDDLRAASEGIAGPVTAFFDMMVPDVGGSVGIVDVAFGLSNIDPDTVADVRYDSFSPMMRIDSGDQNFEYRDGGNGYVEVIQLEAGVKYSVWIEVDYSLNFAEFFLQGGVYATRTSVGLGAFRKDPGDGETVDYFAALLSRGNSVDGPKGVDHMFFDNIAYDLTGQNATRPSTGGGGTGGGGGETWAGFPVDDMGDVDTGGWMGWVNVTNAPWVWNYTLEQYIFIEEANVSMDGAWLFVNDL
ncbi:MAG: hypothetical protein AB3N63_05490 [Puniceicoccaceae bacterium]